MKPIELGAKLYREKKVVSFLKMSICIVSVLLLIFLGSSYANGKQGDFTIDLEDYRESTMSVSVSENYVFDDPRTTLLCQSPEFCTNICGRVIPAYVDFEDDTGTHGGNAYIAYTFYVKNMGTVSCKLEEIFEISGMVKNVSDALRVRAYRGPAYVKDETIETYDPDNTNRSYLDYAKLANDGAMEDHYCDKPFVNNNIVFDTFSDIMYPKDIFKYTIVVWLEGDDPECLDDIRGGRIKLTLKLVVVDPNTKNLSY